jgi:hypothetical protein
MRAEAILSQKRGSAGPFTKRASTFVHLVNGQAGKDSKKVKARGMYPCGIVLSDRTLLKSIPPGISSLPSTREVP